MSVKVVLLVTSILWIYPPINVQAEELDHSNEMFLRLECLKKLPKKFDELSKKVILKTLLIFLESRTRGLTPPYDAQRCADWGYPPLDLPEVPEGWEDSPSPN